MKDVDLIPTASSTIRRRVYAKILWAPGRLACRSWGGAHSQKKSGPRPVIRAGGKGSKVVLVSRVLLALFDRVPLAMRDLEGLRACHSCGHGWCVNRRHLSWKDQSDNELDKEEFDAFCDVVDDLAADDAWEQEQGVA